MLSSDEKATHYHQQATGLRNIVALSRSDAKLKGQLIDLAGQYERLAERAAGITPVGLLLSGERSPSGLWRRTGNAVRGNPSRVRIPPSPPPYGQRASGSIPAILRGPC